MIYPLSNLLALWFYFLSKPTGDIHSEPGEMIQTYNTSHLS